MDWTKDRIQTLSKPEVKQLRANAERLQEPEVVALCDEDDMEETVLLSPGFRRQPGFR